jgi:hypothetical protein
LTPAVLAADAHLSANRVATKWRGNSRGATRGHQLFTGRNPLTIVQRSTSNSPGELSNSATITYWMKSAQPARLEITSQDGQQTFATDMTPEPGINRYFWNMQFRTAAQNAPRATGGNDEEGPPAGFQGRGAQPAPAGTYRVRLTVNGRTYETTLTVREDPDAAAIL